MALDPRLLLLGYGLDPARAEGPPGVTGGADEPALDDLDTPDGYYDALASDLAGLLAHQATGGGRRRARRGVVLLMEYPSSSDEEGFDLNHYVAGAEADTADGGADAPDYEASVAWPDADASPSAPAALGGILASAVVDFDAGCSFAEAEPDTFGAASGD